MNIRVEKQGLSLKEQYELMICTVDPADSQYSPGSVSHVLGSLSVNIYGMNPGQGCIALNGREFLQNARDALIEICKREKIE